MKYKIGDKVRIIRACDCGYREGCELLIGLRQVGTIISRAEGYKEEWRVKVIIKGLNHICHLKEMQLELAKKEIRQYGIVKFLESLEKR